MPITLPALVEHAPDLIGSFVPGKALQERAATVAPPEAAWFKQLTTIAADEHRAKLEQTRIFAQYTAMLKAIAAHRPLLLILEDLQWVDAF
jgi:predicted ATPase